MRRKGNRMNNRARKRSTNTELGKGEIGEGKGERGEQKEMRLRSRKLGRGEDENK